MHGPYDDMSCFHADGCDCRNCRKEGKSQEDNPERREIKKEIRRLQQRLDNS